MKIVYRTMDYMDVLIKGVLHREEQRQDDLRIEPRTFRLRRTEFMFEQLKDREFLKHFSSQVLYMTSLSSINTTHNA